MPEPFVIFDAISRQKAADHIANLSPDKVWEIYVSRYRQKRTNRQNSLYWMWCDEVAKAVSEYTGYDKEDIHEFCKQSFLPGRTIEIEGMEAIRYTTTALNTAEMAQYTDKVYRWATTELGLMLPLPPTDGR